MVCKLLGKKKWPTFAINNKAVREKIIIEFRNAVKDPVA